jgi:hypothetical protein
MLPSFARTLTLLSALLLFGGAVSANAPKGWKLKGSAANSYTTGLDKKIKHSGAASGFLASKANWKKGFGTLLQGIQATHYKGKRIRLSAWIKTTNVLWWAGLWMRVDGKKRKILAFDNMQKRPIRGTTKWTKYSVVLDVDDEAKAIALGVLLSGKGKVWIDSMKLETVGKHVPTTNQLPPSRPKTPQNIGFED